jgi:uncharacterized protein with HEPN domain
VKDDRLYVIHILECIERIEQYTSGGKDAFLADLKTQDAVLRVLQTLAESNQRITDALKAKHPEVDWRSISAFRNVVVHGYLSMDTKRVWDIVENDLPELKVKIEAMSRDPEKNP